MRDLLLSLTATTFTDMPADQKICGCNSCLCVWSGEPTCFLGGQKSTVIAKPLAFDNIKISVPKNAMMLNGTHYVDDRKIVQFLKTSLKHI